MEYKVTLLWEHENKHAIKEYHFTADEDETKLDSIVEELFIKDDQYLPIFGELSWTIQPVISA
jgi:hypothetical protein